ncbi:2-oxoglutarate and iron-dependent oxygenase JMJD4 homolog [Drosophila eugracilis]|uniref:2-oxoglutarate and iron-dependent oxygenase JMJD4 homolog n=1 Tax=Drosophila eugracilis TaxID=29029 RepID=UPI001BD98CCD|nr:2-oxoglutarate and iron-dependent oxygenase JMJD4 homolog [Drosophila eugracilis]
MASEERDGDYVLQLHPEEIRENDGQLPKEIQRCSGLDYNDFFWRYMHKNFPVIITDVSNDWECQNWTVLQESRDLNFNPSASSINFDYLKSKITNCPVPVADCNSSYFNSHTKLELNFYDYLDKWKNGLENQLPSSLEVNSNVSPRSRDNLYLKDWHLAAQMPDYNFYKVPKYFASDWLNEQLIDQKRDDYRFVYMGPKNSWTSYHADVFGSFSWSTNIVGLKKWLIMPPGEELKLNDRLGNPPFSIDEKLLDEHNVRYYTINQRANEAVFVPSGWFHQVWNLTDTISINHNWFNACNISMVWQNLRNNLKAVCEEISDCQQMDNFEAHCQTMLRASFGINYLDFIELLEYIATRRLAEETTKFLLFDSYRMNHYHVQYDLECLRHITKTLTEDPTIQRSPLQLEDRCHQLLARLKL